MSEHEALVETLRKEYCPPIAVETFEALRYDYDDLTQTSSLSELRETLDLIREHAVVEEATGFDPSGTSGQTPPTENISPEPTASSHGRSSQQDIESLSTSLSDFTWEDSVKDDRSVSPVWGNLTHEEKEDRLAALLPQTNRTTIRFKLRQNHYQFEQTMDDLLVLAFLDEDSKSDADGLEAYAAGDPSGQRRKKRMNRKQKHAISSASSANTSSESLAARNVWAASKQDIEFITSRTTLLADSVTSLYHKSGASLVATIRELAASNAPEPSKLQDLDVNMQIHAADLHEKYSNVPLNKIFGLLLITRNVTSAAEDLIRAMTTTTVPVSFQDTKIIPRYTSIDVLAQKSSNTPWASRSSSPSTIVDPTSAQLRAAANRSAGYEAFSKASSAYRRGKSDRYMGGAAAYYADIGRQHIKAAQAQSSAAADSLVSLNETSDSVDLHGISVKDAVRIASQKAQDWWDGLGDAKYVSGGGGALRPGYRIVTGIGRHSKDGAPRIGPAVTKRLMNEGWKIDIGSGEIIVTGKRRI